MKSLQCLFLISCRTYIDYVDFDRICRNVYTAANLKDVFYNIYPK